jgi:hypothetical protein
MYSSYRIEYRVFNTVENTIRRRLRKNRGDDPIQAIQEIPHVAILNQ